MVERPPTWLLIRVVWTGIFGVGILGTTTACYVAGWAIPVVPGVLAIGVYGVLVFMHLALQIVFAVLNRVRIDRLTAMGLAQRYMPRIGLQIVGRREHPVLFEQCLRSVSALTYRLDKVVFVSDGDEPEDSYLADIFVKTFPDATVIRARYVLGEVSKHSRGQLYRQVNQAGKHVCILQPHRHKRHAMYTAFRCLIATGVELIVPTDSDTVLHSDAVSAFKAVMADRHIGAATGNVGVLNVENWLSWLSGKRYWLACNLERASQSFFGAVWCVSGPLGIYRAVLLEHVLDDWLHQKFLGQQCTYGDDRHLTEQMLRRGLGVVYTHRARCLTETPTQFGRWLRQQIRWSRSFARELPYTLKHLHKHSLWMTYDLVTQGIYPFFLATSIGMMTVGIVDKGNWITVAVFAATVFLGGFLRSTYAAIATRDWLFYGFVGYGFLYIAGLLWCRLYALLTIWQSDWGTSERKNEVRLDHACMPKSCLTEEIEPASAAGSRDCYREPHAS